MLPRIALLTALAAASNSALAANILTSIKPIQMITHELTAGVAEPDVLLPANASPHDYALRPSDVKRIHNADLIIWFGEDLEPFLDRALASHSNVLTLEKSPQLVLRSYGEAEEHDDHEEHVSHANHADHHHEEHADHDQHDEHVAHNDEHDDGHHEEHEGHHHDHGSHDPHFWLSVEQAKQAAGIIALRLEETDPQHADLYRKNLARFIKQADETDSEIRSQLYAVQSVPYYVFHEGYSYFEQRYGLNNMGHFTVSPDRKPGAKTLIRIRQSLADNQAKCVFAEPQFQPAVIDTVVRGSKAKIGVLDPLGTEVKIEQGSYFTFLHQLSDSFYQCLAQ
ncbi:MULTISPECIES: zinc ABC transporter substrate-binding protein [Vibrio]|uniref:High-affinity zinc uptake system protein ZnuA n=1 Tax=Vibrio ostreae TaxID=2841925 RepID=A0A975UAM6_9VIBR|nr:MULTISPECIES: zinc ABC transporter substrate-binding protein [Vibrio]QXO18142.1 zinc ABC transporter substrate-binding protein [Vibrio ostreae]WGY47536.1 zinc ABC transporter substrate-binding protein [Vibrio sp. ABG19]